jgi:hypothetical protein
MEVSGQLHVPSRFTSREGALGTHWIGDSVDPRVGLDAMAKRKNPCPCGEPSPGRLARGLVTVLTELSQLHCWDSTLCKREKFDTNTHSSFFTNFLFLCPCSVIIVLML